VVLAALKFMTHTLEICSLEERSLAMKWWLANIWIAGTKDTVSLVVDEDEKRLEARFDSTFSTCVLNLQFSIELQTLDFTL
jgi:hypothetical protein